MDEFLDNLYFDEPIPYKELLIYPVTMRDYISFHWFANCLLLDKNSIPDPQVISMSYLQFLYYISQEQGLPYVYMLKALLCLVLHLDEEEQFNFYLQDGKPYFKIKDIEYNSTDFDRIAEIIMKQNCIEPIDNTVQKEVRDALEEAERYKQRQNSYKICSLEEQMICVMISTALKLEDIYRLTIRKFEKILKRVDTKLHYQIYLSASLSGMVKFENDNAIQHWMKDLSSDDKYADVKVDMDKMRNKIDGVNK